MPAPDDTRTDHASADVRTVDDAQTVADVARRLLAWSRHEGLAPGLSLDIHPRDEMLQGVAEPAAVRPGREPLTYFRSGQEAALVLEHALAAFGRGLQAPCTLLELASGYGRVTRHLLQRLERERLSTCEIVPAAASHVARSFGVESLASSTDPSILAWPHSFNVIFVASLFSHLPRPRFEGWLRHLRRSLADDGVAVLSTHGLWMPQAPAHDGRGFAFHPASESLNLDGHEYGTTFVAPEEVARMAREAGFAGVAWLERELWTLQDVFVLSPRPLRDAHPWRPAPVLDGAIDGVQSNAQGELWLHGWVACRDPDQPVERASLQLDESTAVPVSLHAPRREERAPPDPARRVFSEWHHHAVLPCEFTGRATLALVAETSTQRRCVDVRTLDLDSRRLADGETA